MVIQVRKYTRVHRKILNVQDFRRWPDYSNNICQTVSSDSPKQIRYIPLKNQ